MPGRVFKNLHINARFAKRVLLLTLPAAAVFGIMAFCGLMTAGTALLCCAAVLVTDTLMLYPISSELQALRGYIESLAGGKAELPELVLSVKDTNDLAKAITSIHKLWTSKTAALKAQTLSDAAILDTFPDPILMLDGEGNVTGSNLAARKFTGKDITGLNIDTLFSANIFISAAEKVLKGKSDSERVVFHAAEYGGVRLFAHITKLPLPGTGRSVAVVSLYDVSRAASLEKMQADFVANASHELRTPLSVISGFIETLQTSAKDDPEAADAFLGIMKEQAEYMSALIEDLLSLSRLESGQDKELKDKVDLREALDDVVQALKIKAFRRSVSIKVDVLNRVPKITGDDRQIHQILQNLLDNAVKYAPENSEVTVEMKTVPEIPAKAGQNVAAGKAVSIAFNNKGLKISKEDLPRLTEKFYRMQAHKDMKIKGTGLGLAIAKQIVLHHRGNLTVSSTAYKGNTFTVYLPVRQ